jgi:predicted TIM-barrel fold metal-dependent hydrolase
MPPRTLSVTAAVCLLLSLRAPGLWSQAAGTIPGPAIDAHQHLVSPAVADHASDHPRPAVTLPPELARVLDARIRAERDVAALAELYTGNAWLLTSFDPSWTVGRREIAEWWVQSTSSGYGVVPVGFGVDGSSAFITAYMTSLRSGRPDAHMNFSLARGSDGRWRISTETLTMGGLYTQAPLPVEHLMEVLDTAGIQRAMVLSLAYQLGSGPEEGPDEYAKVRAENDWTAAQAARFPGRLTAFCSFNPLRGYALREVERCAAGGSFRGIKLHFGNSSLDLTNPRHAERVRQVFAAANRLKLPIVVHFAPRVYHGRRDAEVFLGQVLPAAPDIAIQVAHLGSAGHLDARSDSALAVFVEAITARDPRVRNLWFDAATSATPDMSPAGAALTAGRIRQIGIHRVLYGSDTADKEHLAPREGWAAFLRLPLTQEELRTIAGNVPPYARP